MRNIKRSEQLGMDDVTQADHSARINCQTADCSDLL